MQGAPLRGADRQLCVFCATFLQVTLTGRYPAHCPAEFGLSFSLSGGDRLYHCGGDVNFAELLILDCRLLIE